MRVWFAVQSFSDFVNHGRGIATSCHGIYLSNVFIFVYFPLLLHTRLDSPTPLEFA